MNKRSKARGTTNVNLERAIQTAHVSGNLNLIGTKKTGTASVFDIALAACFRSNQKRLSMSGVCGGREAPRLEGHRWTAR
jgi:hypothetical protein